MDWKLEVVVVPVSDVDRAKEFYAGRLGFTLDVDHSPNEAFRVVQVTPPGSACSIVFGKGLGSDSQPGSLKGCTIVVDDIEEAHRQLEKAGVGNGGPVHFAEGVMTPGLDPTRADYGTFIYFDDPDGNTWSVQEVRRHHG